MNFGGRTYTKSQGFDTTKIYSIIDTPSDVGGWPVLKSLPAPAVPQEFSLEEKYPNPLNLRTAISYQLFGFSFVNLRVYDVLGRRVATLADDNRRPNRYQVTFEAGKLTSGVDVYTLSTQSTAEVWPASSVTSKK